jgi:hypothetical protein
LGATLASFRARKVAFWGWVCFLIANIFWIAYGLTQAGVLVPLVVYNMVRALINWRGACNNTKKRKQQILDKRKVKEDGNV